MKGVVGGRERGMNMGTDSIQELRDEYREQW